MKYFYYCENIKKQLHFYSLGHKACNCKVCKYAKMTKHKSITKNRIKYLFFFCKGLY